MAVLRSTKSKREFVSVVTSSDAVISIYALIGNSVYALINLISVENFSALASLFLEQQQDSCNEISNSI